MEHYELTEESLQEVTGGSLSGETTADADLIRELREKCMAAQSAKRAAASLEHTAASLNEKVTQWLANPRNVHIPPTPPTAPSPPSLPTLKRSHSF
jgi:hypothetical protein